MITKDILRTIVLQQKDGLSLPKRLIPREIMVKQQEWFADNRIVIFTGIRRCGKSTLLKQIMQEKKGFCYVNFEHERFLEFQASDFEMLHEILLEVYGSSSLYFFDEIQNIEKFEAFVRRLQDDGKKIIITGSNASLLSKELGTKLTGRYKAVEVYPFSFREFLSFHEVCPTKEWAHTTEKKVHLLRLFSEYLSQGGFPEYLLTSDDTYLRTVYENIIYRDIISRYAIKKQRLLRELVSLLMNSVSSLITYNSLKLTLGLSNAITVKEYISYLCNSYLFFELPKSTFSVRKQLTAPKKVYSIDSGMYRLSGIHFSENKGKILENVIFLELKRRNKEVYYFSEQKECDFIIKNGTKVVEAIQVCYYINDENRQREIASLKEAMKFFKIQKGIIITNDQEEEILSENITIVPAWKWLSGIML